MKIITPYAQIVLRDMKRGGMAMIEMAARNCYKSEQKGEAEQFVKRLIQRGHDAMLEHGDYVFRMDEYDQFERLACALQRIEHGSGRKINITMTNIGERHIVSGNIRAWRELLGAEDTAKHLFAGHIDEVYRTGIGGLKGAEPDPRVHPMLYGDLQTMEERLAHERKTVRFVIDRGVSHEFVRHRQFAFAQESTRYCNYANGTFGREITVVKPPFFEKGTVAYHHWELACDSAERFYFKLIDLGCTPEQARDVLPVSLKTELIMTGTLGAWEHFFDLRARQITGPAHPQAVEVAKPLMRAMEAARDAQ